MTTRPGDAATAFDNVLQDRWIGPALSTVDRVFELLRDAIIEGELPQGMPLRQDQIAQKLGISKIPLREALAKLEAQGFVTIFPRRGVVVSEVRPEAIDEIFHLRLALEPDVLAAAIPNLQPAALDRANALVDQFETSRGTRELGRLNWEIHRALYEASDRVLTLQILANLHLHVDRYVRLHMSLVDLSRDSNEEHRALVAACRVGDVAAAVAVLRTHIEGIRLQLRRAVELHGAAAP